MLFYCNARRLAKRCLKAPFKFYILCMVGIIVLAETVSKFQYRLQDSPLISKQYASFLKENKLVHKLLETYGFSTNSGKVRKHLNQTGTPPQWQLNISSGTKSNGQKKREYYLSQILHVRIYEEDRAKLTIKELKQWMHYMYFAGVEHIFMCDHAQRPSEYIEYHLEKYINLGLVTYIKWPDPQHVVSSKLACYRHVMQMTDTTSVWQASVDMDEYPFVVDDQEEGFLNRYLKKFPEQIVQILMENYLMLGQGDRSKDMVIERINRRTPRPANKLTKPLYRPARTRPGMHRYRMAPVKRSEVKRYKTIDGKVAELMMLHYWGARIQGWGPDTHKVIDMTQEFNVVAEDIAPIIRSSLIAFGETDAFSNKTGP